MLWCKKKGLFMSKVTLLIVSVLVVFSGITEVHATCTSTEWCLDKHRMLKSGLVEACNAMPTADPYQLGRYVECLSSEARSWMTGVGDVCRGPVAFDACIEACYEKGALRCYSACRVVR
jgi:hypothetical protein